MREYRFTDHVSGAGDDGEGLRRLFASDRYTFEIAESRGWIPKPWKDRKSPATRAECIGMVIKL